MVIICGRSLLEDKYFPIINKEQVNSEMLAADGIISQKRLGGLPAIRAPFFPDKSLLITRLDNLSIYYQQDTRRRQIKDTPERDRIENYESVNEAYVVEDYRGVALVENIDILPEETPNTLRHRVAMAKTGMCAAVRLTRRWLMLTPWQCHHLRLVGENPPASHPL